MKIILKFSLNGRKDIFFTENEKLTSEMMNQNNSVKFGISISVFSHVYACVCYIKYEWEKYKCFQCIGSTSNLIV